MIPTFKDDVELIRLMHAPVVWWRLLGIKFVSFVCACLHMSCRYMFNPHGHLLVDTSRTRSGWWW